MLWLALVKELLSTLREGQTKKAVRQALATALLLLFTVGLGTMLADSTVSLLHGGGQASLGKVEDGRYFLRRAQELIEVSETTWLLKRRLELLLDYVVPTTTISGLALVVLASIAKAEKTREISKTEDQVDNRKSS